MCRKALDGSAASWLVLWHAVAAVAPGVAQPANSDRADSRRIVHRFDFDERSTGNVEEGPRHWEPLRPAGFPPYARGSFDFEVGWSAPPSFYLSSEGRGVAYQYVGPDTKVRVNAAYRIVGYIRADRLTHGRACLGAHFLDRYGEPLRGTLVRSQYVGGPDDGDRWVRVELDLAATPPEAVTIGLTAWVLQESVWDSPATAPGAIVRFDIHGGAWFDEVAVYALPRMELTTSVAANVLEPDDAQELRVLLADDEELTSHGRLTIRSVEGEIVDARTVPVVLGTAVEPMRVPLDALPPGVYQAALEVFAGTTPIDSRSLRFAKVSGRRGRPDSPARPFGIVVDPEQRAKADIELVVLDREAVRSVKLPVWDGGAAEGVNLDGWDGGGDLLQELGKRGFALTGVLAGLPRSVAAGDADASRSVLGLLNGDPSAWRESVEAMAVSSGAAFRWWQIGSDDVADSDGGEGFRVAADRVRATMRPFVALPRLAAPLSVAGEATSPRLPLEQIGLVWHDGESSELLASQIQTFRSMGHEHISVFVPPLPEATYRRLPRLAAWAWRLLTARHAGADTVFAPQTWTVRRSRSGPVAEPTEDYLVLRTIADLVGDAAPGPVLSLADSVRCLPFYDGDVGVLAMWDVAAGSKGSRHAFWLGGADAIVDIWGRVTSLSHDGRGRQVIELTDMPVFVPGVDRWHLDLRSAVSLSPTRVEPGADVVRHTLQIQCHGGRPVTGELSLEASAGWQIVPRHFPFSVLPHRPFLQTVEIRYPHNEPAGVKRIVAMISTEGAAYRLEVPLAIEIALSDVEVRGAAYVEDGTLILRHTVANRSSQPLSFRGAATVPGRERQYRPISNLLPGDSQEVQYRIPHAQNLVGRTVHLSLREVNDGPRVHTLQLMVP